MVFFMNLEYNQQKTITFYLIFGFFFLLRFHSDSKSKRKSSKKKKKITSIGINEQELKYFLKNWKLNNLPVKKQK